MLIYITILAYVKDLPSNRMISSFGLVGLISITIYVFIYTYAFDISQTPAAPLQTSTKPQLNDVYPTAGHVLALNNPFSVSSAFVLC